MLAGAGATSTSTSTPTPTPTAASIAAPTSTAASLAAALRSKVPMDPVPLDGDPYARWRGRAPPLAPAGTVCGVRFEPDGVRYRLATFPAADAARAGGHAVTHLGPCGTCSTMQDLATYLERPDLTAPVRRCGVLHPTEAGAVACLERLGFSPACARTWYFDLVNTRRECLGVCLLSWVRGEPSATGPDLRLNDCLRCDEERSGPVFKATAGRTRRSSGLRSSIPRLDDEVAPVVHDYVPPAGAPAPAPAEPHPDR